MIPFADTIPIYAYVPVFLQHAMSLYLTTIVGRPKHALLCKLAKRGHGKPAYAAMDSSHKSWQRIHLWWD